MVTFTSLVVGVGLVLASSVSAEVAKVKIGKTTLVGEYNATTGIEAFLGVKYANHKRFERANLVDYRERETINSTSHAPACSQINNATGWNNYGHVEDCLFLEVYRPHNDDKAFSRKKEKLPVLVWLHGGAGVYGSANAYLGYNFVQQSMSINKPVIVVTINYRLAAWGFLGGKEALKNKAVNLGLHDQRAALEWVQKYIDEFGGDKNKVTLWGESAGSMFTHFHYLDQHSKLFRAGIMQSGTTNSVPALDTSYFQNTYNALVNATGCATQRNSFKCLQEVDLTVLETAVNAIVANVSTYSTRPFGPIVDGELITDTPSKLIARGKFARKPFINGDVLDEGTFSPKPTPMETVEDMMKFFKNDYLYKGATWTSNGTTVARLMELYPDEPAFGSPFNTGNETYGLGAQFKRAAAFAGDVRYQAPRRSWFADALKYRVDGWSYQLSQFTPSSYPAAYGVYHSSDLAYVWLQLSPNQTEYYELAKKMVNYWISFAYTMNPNYKGETAWPQYGARGNFMNFVVGNSSAVPDTFRKEAISFLNAVQDQFGNPR